MLLWNATSFTIMNIKEDDAYNISIYSKIADVSGDELRSDEFVLYSKGSPPSIIGKIQQFKITFLLL